MAAPKTDLFPTAVNVRGLAELNRDFGKLSRALQRELGEQLAEIAEPVAQDVRRRAAAEGYGERTVSGIAAGRRRGSAVVRQRRKKVTGKRPDFGAIQLREVFVPAVEANRAATERRVEDFLERITREHHLPMKGALL